MRKAKTNQNLQTRSNMSGGLSTKLKNKNKINEEDSVQNLELSYFPHDYLLAFREMNKRQKVRRPLFKEWEYKQSAVHMDCNIQENVKKS